MSTQPTLPSLHSLKGACPEEKEKESNVDRSAAAKGCIATSTVPNETHAEAALVDELRRILHNRSMFDDYGDWIQWSHMILFDPVLMGMIMMNVWFLIYVAFQLNERVQARLAARLTARLDVMESVELLREVQRNGLTIKFTPYHLIDKTLAIEAVKQNGDAIRWLPPIFQLDATVRLIATCRSSDRWYDPIKLHDVSPGMMSDESFEVQLSLHDDDGPVLYLTRIRNAPVLEELLDDKDEVEKAVETYGGVLDYMDRSFRNNLRLRLIAAKTHAPSALRVLRDMRRDMTKGHKWMRRALKAMRTTTLGRKLLANDDGDEECEGSSWIEALTEADLLSTYGIMVQNLLQIYTDSNTVEDMLRHGRPNPTRRCGRIYPSSLVEQAQHNEVVAEAKLVLEALYRPEGVLHRRDKEQWENCTMSRATNGRATVAAACTSSVEFAAALPPRLAKQQHVHWTLPG